MSIQQVDAEATTPVDNKINVDPLMTMKEAAAYLNIGVSTMYDLAKQEKFPIVLITSDKKIRKSVLDEFIARREEIWSWSLLETLHN